MKEKFSASELGIFGVSSVSPAVYIGAPEKNVDSILAELRKDRLRRSQFIVFPELCITGYTCADLFFQDVLLHETERALIRLSMSLAKDDRLIAVGAPLLHDGRLYNCAVIMNGNNIFGVVPKIHIPNYQEFYEKRWFTSGNGVANERIKIDDIEVPFGTNLVFDHLGVKVGIEICEDLWVPSPPSSTLCMHGAEIILNLSATDDNIGKYQYIKNLIAAQSGRCRCVYAYASAGGGESSTDLVFSGINIIAVDGNITESSERFSRKSNCISTSFDLERLRNDRRKYSTFFPDSNDNEKSFISVKSGANIMEEVPLERMHIKVSSHPFIPDEGELINEHCHEIVDIQSWGLAQRLLSTGCRNLVVGVSGGLDSTLALLVARYTFNSLEIDSKGIVGVTMPAVATSDRTHNNAGKLMEYLGVTFLEIPVREAVELHFNDIGHNPRIFDAVYENSQARERTQILMDLANKFSGMVLGTGDMSELALGWCTYNGDHMSMYNVNAGVPKTLVKYLVKWFADTSEDSHLKEVLYDILATPISPELVPSSSEEEIGQKTEELIGPYELHDFFLFHVLRNGFSPRKIFSLAAVAFKDIYPRDVIKKWLVKFYRRFFSQQFKRSCMPDGPKIGSVCLSPRGDWRMPSDACADLWIKEAESLPV